MASLEALTEAVKHDTGKPRLDLVPFDALLEVGAVLAYGEKKYAARNWEKGLDWGRLVAAALRHLSAWMGGQERDTESGHHHLAHFCCCALMLFALVLRQKGLDSRKVIELAAPEPDHYRLMTASVPINAGQTVAVTAKGLRPARAKDVPLGVALQNAQPGERLDVQIGGVVPARFQQVTK